MPHGGTFVVVEGAVFPKSKMVLVAGVVEGAVFPNLTPVVVEGTV